MKEYQLQTSDLSTSLVFYRALLGHMPTMMGVEQLSFETPHLRLHITESTDPTPLKTPAVLPVAVEQIPEVYERMKRFMARQQWMEACEVLDASFGLADPDGNRWIIGDEYQEVAFEKCYYKTETLK